jgi:hypothetical protein
VDTIHNFAFRWQIANCVQWGYATGNAVPVATATFYVLKDNKAEKIP